MSPAATGRWEPASPNESWLPTEAIRWGCFNYAEPGDVDHELRELGGAVFRGDGTHFAVVPATGGESRLYFAARDAVYLERGLKSAFIGDAAPEALAAGPQMPFPPAIPLRAVVFNLDLLQVAQLARILVRFKFFPRHHYLDYRLRPLSSARLLFKGLPGDLVVRQAHDSDVPAIIRFLETLDPIVRPDPSEVGEAVAAAAAATAATASGTGPDSLILVLDDLKDPSLGAMGFIWGQVFGPDHDNLFIRQLAVSESYRRKGYGRRLMDEMLKWGTGRGADRAMLWAEEDNAKARRLFESVGFYFSGEEEMHLVRRAE
ncbi:MAG: GNAT family N-acetyltransferase [Bacillota bacterium]